MCVCSIGSLRFNYNFLLISYMQSKGSPGAFFGRAFLRPDTNHDKFTTNYDKNGFCVKNSI